MMLRKYKFTDIINLIIEEGWIDYAESKLLEVSMLSRAELEIFDESDLKEGLITALEFNLTRVT